MNEYWETVFLIFAWINFFGALSAAVWLGVGAFDEGDRRMWIESCLCTVIWVLTAAHLVVSL